MGKTPKDATFLYASFKCEFAFKLEFSREYSFLKHANIRSLVVYTTTKS